MTQADQPKPDAWDRVIRPWWAKLIIGIIMILLAVSTYNDFAKLESGERDSLLVGRSTRILYDLGGKPLATGVPAAVGLGFIAWGTVQLARGNK